MQRELGLESVQNTSEEGETGLNRKKQLQFASTLTKACAIFREYSTLKVKHQWDRSHAFGWSWCVR